MTKLKLGPIADDKPVKVTVELPAACIAISSPMPTILGRETGQPPADPVRLIVPMLERFIATDARSPRRGGPRRQTKSQPETRQQPVTSMAPPTGSPST